ncbi:uncharacterized protein LOC102081728 isoform X2 [Oreochromis niloticus]|uniref:uncharacterized protein LOC102081728 isoform X2 n=1 Tax=Oreochromis niloticus TaxID=8128 RepID=UPI00090529C0|nr:uncharacterized protein LOC102081728 isoform X2 [Oreochromis niloticus]
MTDINPHAKKPHGLVNQGATCYLNSVLQVLFMTKDFREAVTRDSDPLLKHLFETLEKKTATTSRITQKLKIQVCEQRDAAEYFEKILSDTSVKASQIFQGELTHKNTCCECKTDTNTSDPFWSLPLALESDNNEYNVEKELKDFFQEVCIDGDNQLYCEICDAKAGAKIKLEMTRYPDVLTLLLKRFKFDYRYQEHVKIKRAVTVPDTLQIPENQTYELYAFVEHFGDLRSGHYTVTIKSQDDDRWYNFNDTCVRLLPEGPFQLERNKTALTRSSTAYLLFYRRKKMHAADTQHISEAPTGGASANEQQEQVVKTTGRDEANKYHGLVNQGATCYLNSVLQVLFMTKEFRKAVTRNPGRSQYIDHPLDTLFDNLKKNTAYTHEISSKLDINSVSVQGDAAECFEKILCLTSPEASQIFQGVLTHRNKCSTCSTETGTDDPFWTLPLQLVESDIKDYNVAHAIAKYFSQSDASGVNQLYCDQCGCKCDAAIKLEMRHHPDVLTLLLKRFKFDHRYQVYIKMRQEVIVPKTLQISENQTYELYAFVEHFGDLRSGHYTVTIKSQDDEDDDRWYNFDDTYVRLLPEGPFQLERNKTALTRSSTAYLLFYRRKKMHAADTQHISEAPTGGASANEQQEQVVKTTGRDEGEAAGMDHNLVDIQGKDQQMIMKDVENKDESKQEKEKEKYSAKTKNNKEMEHADNESSDQITKKRKTNNQESEDHKNDVAHQQDANLKPRKGSDHQDKQHSLKVEQDEEMRDKDRQMMIAVMVDSNSTDEANRSKTRDGKSGSVVHKDSSDMFQSSGKVDEGNQNMSENDEEQKKNDKQHETDGKGAQRRDKTKTEFCESEKNKYRYLLADGSQRKEQHNNNGHDGGREWSLSGSNRLTENYRSSTGNEQMKPHSQSELWVTQSLSRPRSMNTQTQKMSEDVDDILSKFKELNLNEPLHFGQKFKKKRKGHEQVFSNISETKQEQQKEIIKYGQSRPNNSRIYAYYKTTLTQHDDESSTSKQNGQRSPQLEIHSVEVIGHEEIIKMKLKRDYQQIPGDVDQQQTGNHTGKQNNDEEVEREQTKEISKPYCGESGKD